MKFLKKLFKLIKVAIPNYFGRESMCLIVSSALMIARTYLTIYISEINGSIVKSIVKMSFPRFMVNLIALAVVCVPAAMINSGIEYISRMFSAFLRENLTKHLHNNYLENMCFYQVKLNSNKFS